MGWTVQNQGGAAAEGAAETLYQTARTRVSRRFGPDGAMVLKQPLGTVKTWVRRGLERLKGCLSGA